MRDVAIVPLAALGLGVSGYLLYEHYCAPIVCIGSGCALVDASPYSEIFGVPLSIFGLVSYGFILTLALLSLRAPAPQAAWLHAGIYGMALTGTLFSAYLTYVELAIIHAVCTWCVSSAVLITLILLLAIARLQVRMPAGQWE
jgi:uncharacterized membrane protein